MEKFCVEFTTVIIIGGHVKHETATCTAADCFYVGLGAAVAAGKD